MVPVALGVATIVFVVLRLTGNPVDLMLGSDPTPEARASLMTKLGLDQPIPVQYVLWLAGILRGDLGESLLTGQPVVEMVSQRAGATLLLTFSSLFVSLAIGVTLGVVAGTHRGQWIDRISALLATVGVAMPTFWLGLLLVSLFAVQLGWLPTGFMMSPRNPELSQIPRHLLLPMLTLALPSVALITRLTRSSMLEVIGQEYIRTARAKGLAEWTLVTRHAMKNALLPVVTVAGIQLGHLLGGAIVVESIFNWPGIGNLMLVGISSRDYPLVQGAVIYTALAFTFSSLIVDLLYRFVDPRIRYE